ncbi:MAG TPA: hypothetical protein VHM02_11980 [Thermoanaerobaculia bacterium]|nr:hypothetical protein [Thermoanaerobaculia bacterium]
MTTRPRGPRRLIPYLLLLLVKGVARLFWSFESKWVGEVPAGDRWKGIRLVVILNHTSLYEWVFAGLPPARFLAKLARHGVVPVAAKTLERRWVGKFFGLVAAHVVPLTRHRDETWQTLLAKVDDRKAMVIILPEGKMMRRNGFDGEGKPMSVRGGVADLLLAIPEGRLLFAYSGGLHHVQAPGDRWPGLFRTVRMDFEVVDLASYRDHLLAHAGRQGFRDAVIADMEERLIGKSPVRPGTAPIPLWPYGPSARARRALAARRGGGEGGGAGAEGAATPG